MNPDEYARMRDVEDRHWWYRALRASVWETYATVALEREPPTSSTLLDIGCGTGGTLAACPVAHASRPRGFGIDRSRDALRFSRARGQCRLAQADAAQLPFPDATFANAIMLDVLYHRAVVDPVAVLREAHRVLAPGGHLIVNVPAYDWLRSTHDEAIHTERRFTRPQLRALLVQAGFQVTRATYWNTLLFPAAAATRLLRRDSGRAESDLAGYRDSAATAVAHAALAIERAVLRAVDLPFGLSILAVARKC